MKRVIVTLSDDLACRLAALREYLEGRGVGAHVKQLRITPSEGSGAHDVSLDHDRYLAGSSPDAADS